MALIEAKDLSLGYDSQVLAAGLSFKVEPGDYLCIVGENGSGKSTLVKTLLGLVEPLSGEVSFGDGLRKNEIGYLPQQTAVQRDFPASVREIVLSGRQGRAGFRPFYGAEDRRTASEAMRRMGIEALSEKSYRDLSGGQQQRVLLARALCATRRLLLLDEPVSGLDPLAAREMYGLIGELSESGISVVMVSHDIASAVRRASHVLHMGEYVFFGTRAEYAASSAGRFFMREGMGEEGGRAK